MRKIFKCEWCGLPIPPERAEAAIVSGEKPKYCSLTHRNNAAVERHRRRHENWKRRAIGPSQLRNFFCATIEEVLFQNLPGPWWEILTDEFAEETGNLYGRVLKEYLKRTPEQRGDWLCRQLWNCTSIVPGPTLHDMDIRQGATYAQAVRRLRAGDVWE